jgi:hypothetical protein
LLSLLVVVAVSGAVLAARLIERVAPRPARADCALLLDRWAAQTYRARNPDARPDTVAHFGRQAAHDSGAEAQLAACERELSALQVACALAAPNVDEMERCVQ